MSVGRRLEVALGPRARISELEWRLRDPEAARIAVSVALAERTLLAPGFAQPGRVGLRAPQGILTFWPGELMARVGAGTTVADLEDVLEGHGLSCGLEVPAPRTTTLGACFADARAGLAGPAGIRLRDRCTGLGFVDGSARVLAAGSRVVKNVAGYDFGRLHHAARGSLGLVLDFTIRLLARPERRAAVWWSCDRGEVGTRLPELRSAWGQDTWSELWVDRVAAARFGLPGAGLVFRQVGDADLIAGRIERSNAADVSRQWENLLGASLRPARTCPATLLAIEDPGEDCVVELGFGVARSRDDRARSMPRPSRAALAMKRVFDPHGIWPRLPGLEGHPR